MRFEKKYGNSYSEVIQCYLYLTTYMGTGKNIGVERVLLQGSKITWKRQVKSLYREKPCKEGQVMERTR